MNDNPLSLTGLLGVFYGITHYPQSRMEVNNTTYLQTRLIIDRFLPHKLALEIVPSRSQSLMQGNDVIILIRLNCFGKIFIIR